MFTSNNTFENSSLTVNFLEESITWKVGMFNPKLQNKVRMAIEMSNNGKAVYPSDFTL